MSDLVCRRCGAKAVEWDYTEYSLLQLLPGDGFIAVWANDDGTQFSADLDFVGLAKMDTVSKRGHADHRTRHEEEVERGSCHVVVGVILDGGCEYIVNEDSNFCGIARKGTPLHEVYGCLPGNHPSWEVIASAAARSSAALLENPQSNAQSTTDGKG